MVLGVGWGWSGGIGARGGGRKELVCGPRAFSDGGGRWIDPSHQPLGRTFKKGTGDRTAQRGSACAWFVRVGERVIRRSDRNRVRVLPIGVCAREGKERFDGRPVVGLMRGGCGLCGPLGFSSSASAAVADERAMLQQHAAEEQHAMGSTCVCGGKGRLVNRSIRHMHSPAPCPPLTFSHPSCPHCTEVGRPRTFASDLCSRAASISQYPWRSRFMVRASSIDRIEST